MRARRSALALPLGWHRSPFRIARLNAGCSNRSRGIWTWGCWVDMPPARPAVAVLIHTAPVAMVASLEAGIDRILSEGLDAVTARHQEAGGLLQDGLQEMGLELFAQEGHRLPQLTTVNVPEGVDSAKVRGYLLDRFNIEIGGGVGEYASTVWRIGLMGPNANPGSVALLLSGLKEAIAKA